MQPGELCRYAAKGIVMKFITDPDISTHLLAFLVLLSRLADIISTRLVTPTLKLEANPIARRLGWRFAYATLLIAAVPYYSKGLAVCVFTLSFLVSGSNLFRGWVARALGEEEYMALMRRVGRGGNRYVSLGFVLAAAASYAIVGILLMCLSGSESEWGYWFGLGIVLYGLTIAIYGSASILRVFRMSAGDNSSGR
jgi:hypothetical protein